MITGSQLAAPSVTIPVVGTRQMETFARRHYLRGRPGLAGMGSSGAISSHSAAVRSLG